MAKDIYHDIVVAALEKDGWQITDNPLRLKVGGRSTYVDLGAQKIFAAQKNDRRIAVEVKSFLSPSPVKDLEQALGQYVMYAQILSYQGSDRILYLAIPENIFLDFFSEELPQMLVKMNGIKFVVFDPQKEEIVEWKI